MQVCILWLPNDIVLLCSGRGACSSIQCACTVVYDVMHVGGEEHVL